MTVTLDGLTFDIDDFTGNDGLGHTEILASTTGAISGATYPPEARFPNRVFRALLYQLAADNSTTSTTSHDISAGSKTFTLASPVINLAEFVVIAETSTPSNYLYGQVTAKSGSNITVNVTAINGSGTGITAWTVSGGAGIRGASGTDGADGLGVPTPTANGFGQIPVQNDADNDYQFLSQGSSGEVLVSQGSDALPIWQGNYARTNVAQEYTAAQNFNATALSDAANISWNLNTAQVTSVTLGGNRTLDNPTNMKDGGTYILRVVQDGTGSRTLAYGSAYKWAGGSAPTLSTSTNAVDILTFVSDGTNMYGVAQLDFS